MSGRYYDWDMSPLYKDYYDELGPSRHYTNLFNVFVWLQIFSMINSRKINDEKNVFGGILSNFLFIIVFFFIMLG